MALQLFKLASEAFPSITSTSHTSQAAHAYFRTMSNTVTIAGGGAYSLKVTTWVKETGNPASVFATGQGYTSLCINGVLQQPGLYTVGASSVVIRPTSALTLQKGYPITLQTFNVDATMSITVSALVSSLIAIP